MSDPQPIFTIGHSTRSIPEFVDLLRAGPADLVVDVRTVPKSRRNPQYNEDVLAAELAPYQLGYRRIAGLGGLRGKSRDVPRQVNGFWENQSFHNYADYALSEEFASALDQLLAISCERRCAIMCAEAVPWRCHRNLLADEIVRRKIEVIHILGPGSARPHELNRMARIEHGRVIYPPEQSEMF